MIVLAVMIMMMVTSVMTMIDDDKGNDNRQLNMQLRRQRQ